MNYKTTIDHVRAAIQFLGNWNAPSGRRFEVREIRQRESSDIRAHLARRENKDITPPTRGTWEVAIAAEMRDGIRDRDIARGTIEAYEIGQHQVMINFTDGRNSRGESYNPIGDDFDQFVQELSQILSGKRAPKNGMTTKTSERLKILNEIMSQYADGDKSLSQNAAAHLMANLMGDKTITESVVRYLCTKGNIAWPKSNRIR